MQNPRRCWSWGAGHWGPALRSSSHCSHSLHRRPAEGQGWRRRPLGGRGAGGWGTRLEAAGPCRASSFVLVDNWITTLSCSAGPSPPAGLSRPLTPPEGELSPYLCRTAFCDSSEFLLLRASLSGRCGARRASGCLSCSRVSRSCRVHVHPWLGLS